MMQTFRRYMSYIMTAFLCICMLPSAEVRAAEGRQSQTIDIPVEITAEGVEPSVPETYVVRLTSQTESAPMPDGAAGDTAELSIQGTGEGAFSFTYSRTGVFLYKIAQNAGAKTNCEYDRTVYDLYVYVTRNADNGLDINAYMEKGVDEGKPEKAEFHNVYSGSAEYSASVKKVVDVKSGTAPKDSVFTFRMTPESASYPMPEAADASGGNTSVSADPSTGALTLNVKGAGEYDFGQICFDASCCGNTYVYTIDEVDKGEDGYTYDANTYKLTIKPVPSEDGMSLEVFITDESGEVSEMVFTNTYDGKKTPDADEPDKPGKPGKPSQPGNSGDKEKTGKSTKTGDENNLLLWGLAGGASLIAIIALVLARRKKDGRQ